jgi:hypothetical protein
LPKIVLLNAAPLSVIAVSLRLQEGSILFCIAASFVFVAEFDEQLLSQVVFPQWLLAAAFGFASDSVADCPLLHEVKAGQSKCQHHEI